MFFNVGDCVTRNSYDNDIIFKITGIENRTQRGEAVWKMY